MDRCGNHIAAGAAAAVALPLAVFALGLPLILALPLALAVYAGTALALTPRPRRERIDFRKVGQTQAEVVAGLIDEGEASVARLRAAAAALQAEDGRRAVESLAATAQKILDRLAAAPEKLPAVRRFLASYLPSSVEIAEGLVTLERQSAPDRERRVAITTTLAKLDQAFAFYADGFDQGELAALDVELKLIGAALAEDLGPASAPAGVTAPARKE